jgi:DNA-directed RNA polymerase specialized sigma24 family protein
MDEQRSPRARALFAQAADLSEGERGAFLDAACAGEPALRADLESLLAFDSSFELGQRDDSFLNSPVVRVGEETLRMQKALKSLDPLDRKVIALRHFERLGRVETAKALGISQEDGSRRYLGALKRLKDALAALPGGSDALS